MKTINLHKELLVMLLGLITPCVSIHGQLKFEESYSNHLIAQASSDSAILNLIHLAEKKLYNSPDSTLAYGKLLLKTISNLKDSSHESKIFELVGKSYDFIGKRDSAKYWFERSLGIRIRIGEPNAVVETYYHLGLIKRRSAEYEEALEYYLKGVGFSQKEINQPTRMLGKLYSSIGLVYGKLEQDERALDYLNKGLEIRKSIGDSLSIGTSYLSIGNFYAERGNYSLAQDYFQKSVSIYSQINYQGGLFRVKNSLANILYEQAKYEQALELYEGILAMSKERGDQAFEILVRNNMGSALHELKRYDEAMTLFQGSIDIIDEKNDPEMALSLHINLSNAKYQKGNIREAYSELKKALKVQTSILEKKTEAIQRESDRRLQIEEQALQLELEKEQALAEQAQIKLANRNLMTGILIGVLCLLVGIGWMISRYRIRQRRVLFEHRIDRLLQEQEEVMFGAMIQGQERAYSSIAQELHDNIGMLLSATNLHFSSLEEKLDSQLEAFQQAKSTLLKAVKEVRTLSRDMLSGTLHHLGLVESIENVLEVVKQTGHYEVSLDLVDLEEAEIPPSVTHALYRCVQELLSNVIKHAHATQIDLQLVYQANELILIFKDNGIGIQLKQDAANGGMGLKSIKSRIAELRGTCEINSSSQDGTTIILHLPLPGSKSEWVTNHSQSLEP